MKGIAYEKAVAAVQAMMDPNSKVEHNVQIPDRDGIKRQFDVVVRGNIGGVTMLIVIECKDQKRKVGIPAIEAFYAKSRSVRANMPIFVSRSGFTKSAIIKAKAYDMCVLSLVRKDGDEPLKLKSEWFMESYAWSQVQFQFHFSDESLQLNDIDCNAITYDGHKLLDWWSKRMDEYHHLEEGDYEHTLDFTEPREFTIESKPVLIKSVSCIATRTKEILKKSVSINTDGFYDWSQEQVKVPSGATITTGNFLSDFSDWEKHEGSIPKPSGFFDWRIKGYGAVTIPYNENVIDFDQL